MPSFSEIKKTKRQIKCKQCGSEEVWRNGKEKDIQYFRCKNCDYRFSGIDTYPTYHYEKEIINQAFTYYYGGMSFGIMSNAFEELGKNRISKSTLWEWITKFTNLAIPYIKSLEPMVGDVWVADETMIMMHGKNKWLWAIIDEDTRYLLACNLTTTRTSRDAQKLFYEAYLNARKKPYRIITDKLPAYNDAFKKVFWSRSIRDRPVHAHSGGFVTETNQNLIERWHEYIKQRTKIMRHFKNPKSAFTILQGVIINYNYLWEHSYLENITPAEASGIDVKDMGITNWLGIIELAKDYNKIRPNPSYTFYYDELKRLGK